MTLPAKGGVFCSGVAAGMRIKPAGSAEVFCVGAGEPEFLPE